MKRGLFLLTIFSFFAIKVSGQEYTSLRPSSEGQPPSDSSDKNILLEGIVVDEKTNEPVKAQVDIYFDSDFILDAVQNAEHGSYSQKLSHYGWYIVNVVAPGYLHETDTLWVLNDRREVIRLHHQLRRIEVGVSIILENVYFYFGHTTLKPESNPALNAVAELLKQNPNVRCEIGGHTDDEGANDYNLMLSEGRAKAVVEYLVRQGIDPSKLSARGYGESKPIDTGITKAAKARNRRVEFVVLEVGGS